MGLKMIIFCVIFEFDLIQSLPSVSPKVVIS
jgi:hypothetical protein